MIALVISSKEISASESLRCPLDIFLLVGILFNNLWQIWKHFPWCEGFHKSFLHI